MKVHELRRLLDSFSDDAEVHYTYPSGDHWRTQLAPLVRKVGEGVVKHNGYHDMDELVDVDFLNDIDEEGGDREVVILG